MAHMTTNAIIHVVINQIFCVVNKNIYNHQQTMDYAKQAHKIHM